MANRKRQTENYEWNENDAIGFGAFGRVFKGKHRSTDHNVAVKVCPLQRNKADGQKDYIEEIHVLQGFDSPYITKYFSDEKVSGSDTEVAIVMELADGSLESELKKEVNRHGLPKEVWLVLVDNCVGALEYLHDHKLSHRDVKPANILRFRKSEEPGFVFKFCDFGLSRLLDDESEYMSSVLGTPPYMHPRMFEGIITNNNKVSCGQEDVDIWATACSLFEAATGLQPFATKNQESSIAMSELFKQRPPDTAYAYFDNEAQVYVYKQDMPKQHFSYKKSFRSIVARYFQMVFSKEETFLNIKMFSALSREMISVKEHEFFCLNTLTTETYCDTTSASYLPKKTLKEALDENKRKNPDQSEKLLKTFSQKGSEAAARCIQYEEPFLAAVVPHGLFKECCWNQAATLQEGENSVRLQIETADHIITIEKSDCMFLQFAIQEKIPSLVAYLRTHWKSRPDKDTSDRGVLLITAVKDQNYDAAVTLLAEGAPLNAVDESGESALGHAASKGDFDLVKLLMHCDAPVFSKNKQGMTPLHSACGEGHYEIADYLLENGADINARSKDGATPLMLAATNGKKDVAELLIRRKADINVSTKQDGRTALRDAAYYGHAEIVTLLVENGAQINPKENVYTAFHYACQQGFVEIAAYLLDKGAEKNRIVDRATPLMQASCNDRLEVAKLLLDNGADVDVAIQDDGRTAVRDAAYHGFYNMVALLTKHGAKIDAIEQGQLTPLHCAAMRGYTEIARYLLDERADINSVCQQRYTPLILAARNGFPETAELLINRGADVNVFLEESGETALHHAINRGHLRLITMLVEHGAKFNFEGNDQSRMLHRAAQLGYTDLAIYLLDSGINVNSLDELGATPLMQAAASGKLGMAITLIDRGADISVVANDGETALQDAADSGNLELVMLLVDKGAKIDSVNKDKLTPFHYACEKGYTEVATYLLEKGANINVLDEMNSTPLMLAAVNGQEEMAQFLVSQGADINARRRDGETALHCASESGLLDLVVCLIESGAQVNSENEKKLTPLHYACQKGYTRIVSYLLEKGSTINAATKDGETPLTLAERNGKVDIVSLLEKHGAKRQPGQPASWKDWLLGFSFKPLQK